MDGIINQLLLYHSVDDGAGRCLRARHEYRGDFARHRTGAEGKAIIDAYNKM